jgi:hypothetical protein
MTEKVLFTAERNGIKAELVEQIPEALGARVIRVHNPAGTVDFTPEQGDMIGALASLARTRK